MKPKSNDAFSNPTIKVPFFRPSISKEDKTKILETLSSPLLTDGPKLREFESAFAKFTGSKYAVGVSNATSALNLSLESLGIGKNDEVIVPDLTFIATASSVLLTGAKPVLADVDTDDLNISISSIEKKISSRTKAIIPVHFAGRVCNIKDIMKIARAHNLYVIEDCAHAIGAKLANKHVGLFGDAGCFSFYPTKNFTTIEGGMIITKSKRISDYVKTSRNHGLSKSLLQRFSKGYPWDYDVVKTGYNYRLDEIRASLGISQLKQISKFNRLRKKACKYYNDNLKNINGIQTPTISKNQDNVYHLYIIKILSDFPISRNELYEHLIKLGIRTSVHYKPLHYFSLLKNDYTENSFPNSENLYEQILSLPLYPSITTKEQDFVINCIKKIT